MIKTLLIANRGEVAVRLARAAVTAGLHAVAVAAADDTEGLHTRLAAEVRRLPGRGPAAYLDVAALTAIAAELPQCAVHPGYGFLSESAAFARACAGAGAIFVGPTPDQLDELGDKVRARALAARCGVPVLPGSDGPVSQAQARAFLAAAGQPVMLKALAGGGGRGIRLVRSAAELPAAFERATSEAERSCGDGRLYAEQALATARHIEIQVLGDGTGQVADLGDRDCTLQRRNQKLIEMAPSPFIGDELRASLAEAARRMAAGLALAGAATFEFLVGPDGGFYFLEANPRLQVEHTVTEQATGVDLVLTQLALAGGRTLDDLALAGGARPRGFAVQARVNTETQGAAGPPLPGAGVLTEFAVPTGPGVRVDTAGYRGYQTATAYDSLLAKVIATAGSYAGALRTLVAALGQFGVGGPAVNLEFLQAVLARPEVLSGQISTSFIEDHLPELAAPELAGPEVPAAPGLAVLRAPVQGVVVSVAVTEGETVAAGHEVAVIEAMKMQYPVTSPAAGQVGQVLARPGAEVRAGDTVVIVLAASEPSTPAEPGPGLGQADPGLQPRADLAEVTARHEGVLDDARPEAVARRRAKNARTARENVADLCDPGTFREFGPLVIAGQRQRRPVGELIRRTPGDGVITGFGQVNGTLFPPVLSRSLVIAFDDTVLAGTMGELARDKLKRTLAVAAQDHRPVVLFAEGGGGRAGDTDGKVGVTGWSLDVSVYHQFGQLSGLVPIVGVAAGRTFAANAGILACCDVIIATRDANIGVGGPAMIEGGRLGRYRPEEIGPVSVQAANGVVDLIVADEAEAVAAARTYLAFFQGPVPEWSCCDQRAARALIPEDRHRAYDIRAVISTLADTGSVLELRRDFGPGMVTALGRVQGRPVGIVANNPLHLGGAIDSPGADKASRFLRLCDAFDVPVLMLCDTPGMMVGPDAEAQASVRKMGRMFVTGANLSVPVFAIVLRKAYGIGAELMAGGWFRAPRFVISWPTGEFGGMNIEGNVQLGYAAELAAITDPDERRAFFDAKVAELYATGHAISVSTHFEVDDVIDPADSRAWISAGLSTHVPEVPRRAKKLPYVDPW